MIKKFTFDDSGYEVEIGKVANQADGAVWFKQGGTILLATVVQAASKEFPGFLPLSVDYREQYSAAGKIPGGYFKREGRASDKEVLTSRLIDRALRPLFPENYFNQLQVLVTVYSVDKKHTPYTIALLASSIALGISKIPFLGPVGVVEVGRIDGKFVLNPQYADSVRSDLKLIVAGTFEGICMVEGSSKEISEADFLDALFLAHDHIKKQVLWQREIIKQAGVAKEEVACSVDWNMWKDYARKFLKVDYRIKGVWVADKTTRNEYLDTLRKDFISEIEEKITELGANKELIRYIFDEQLNEEVTEYTFAVQKRVDERKSDQIRDITSEVGLLPFTHGSALFQRGSTQALVSVTLGGGQDEQKVENLMDEVEDRAFMLHYNFPPFSVGEVKPIRGPGRREVGHGYLAAGALKAVLPDKKDFPYTIRVVSDILESNGSSSMATTCGATLALMQAGVPISTMISGIAMGLLMNHKGEIMVLSDISGFEDAFGLMDFKVTGSDSGITAIQMDVKHKGGFSRQVFEKALEQAREGRMHILGEMRKTISKPEAELSELVPKVITFKVDQDKIGAIIGPGGKIIRGIIEKTGTTIDIEDDGTVKVFGGPNAKLDLAINWVKTLGGQIESGMEYTGKIRRIVEFGIFVELVPGQDGLVHVSSIPREKQRTFATDYKVDDVVTVKVIDYDHTSGRVRIKILD